MTNIISISFSLTFSDYTHFYKVYRKKHLLLYNNGIFIIALALAIILWQTNWIYNIFSIQDTFKFPESLIKNSILLNIAYNLAVLSGLIYLIRFLFSKLYYKRLKQNPFLFYRREISLTDEKIIFKTDYSTFDCTYSIVHKYVEYNHYCFLGIMNQSIIIIPKNVEGFKEFSALLKEKLNVR
jgi:hypothetical protein